MKRDLQRSGETAFPAEGIAKCGGPESGTWLFLGIGGRPEELEGRGEGKGQKVGDLAGEAGRGLSRQGPAEVWMGGSH